MTNSNHSKRFWGLVRTMSFGAVASLALLANFGDRAFSASPANTGIDPLEVLNLQIRNNAIVLLDSSGSMRDAQDYTGFSASGLAAGEFAGDSPDSKLMNAKQAIRKLISDNQTKVSFKFGRYTQAAGSFGAPQYLYTCSTAANPSNEIPCAAGGAGASGYIDGFAAEGNRTAVDGSKTVYGVTNSTYKVNQEYHLTSSGTACGTTPISTITAGAWTQPIIPSNWNLPDVPAGTNPGGPPFVDVVRYTTGACTTVSTRTRFYFRGARWANKANDGGSVACGGFSGLLELQPCTQNSQLALVDPKFVGPEFVPTITNNDSLANLTSGATATAIRASGPTPLAESLIDIKSYFNSTLWPTLSPLTTVKPKTFVIILTDGDDSCTTATNFDTSPAADLTLRAAHKAQILYAGVTGSTDTNVTPNVSPDPASKVETFVVAFGGAVNASINTIAWGGSGMVRTGGQLTTTAGNSVTGETTRWVDTLPTAADRAACTTCVDAFPASNLDQLSAALQAAIDLGSASGEYSDQQSVTESVYEFDPLIPAPLGPIDPLNPKKRYSASLPILMQSTFVLPAYDGHLRAFNGNTQLWDAGQRLRDRVLNGVDDSSSTDGMLAGTYAFTELYGNATDTTVKTSTARIKRRIYTTLSNGVNSGYTASNLLNVTGLNPTAPGNPTVIPLWPPTRGTTTNTTVAPTVYGTSGSPVRGILDTAFGFDALTTFAQVQAAVPGACQGTPLHADCTSSDAVLKLLRAKAEAREILLANLAGAKVYVASGIITRNATTKNLQYQVKPWILAESTLAAPGIVTPPLDVESTFRKPEYILYKEGVKRPAGDAQQFKPENGLANGLGLRHPDLSFKADASLQTAAADDATLKPSMSVVYHATNQGLHAFRAGPCPTASASSGLFGTSLDCKDETGGEELWAFVPFDELSKLSKFVTLQNRTNKQYLLATPVRFSDVFVPVPGAAGGVAPGTQISKTIGATSTGNLSGVWRTMLFVGRGQGGKSYTAIDVTTPGPFTTHSLNTGAPLVVWNRGNPDTSDGLPYNAATNTYNNTTSAASTDYGAYLKMGETWSVPAVGLVPAASYTTARSASGVDFALFVGSGYSDVSTEGKTFYVLDALSGDVIRSHDIINGSPAGPVAPDLALTNALVSSPTVYSEDATGKSPTGFIFLGNPVGAPAKIVYFGDLHSRIWRFDVSSPATTPVKFFEALTGSVGNQPFASSVSIQQRVTTAVPAPPEVLVFAESGNDNRISPKAAPKGFKMYAWKDINAVRTDIFTKDFDLGYRGVVQPATAFTSASSPVVFYGGVKFNPPAGVACASSFDSVLVALKSTVTVPGVPEAAFDLQLILDDASIVIPNQKITNIRPSATGLIIDKSFNPGNPINPPDVSVGGSPSTSGGAGASTVYTGLTPGSMAYIALHNTTVPYRVGSSVCRTEYQP